MGKLSLYPGKIDKFVDKKNENGDGTGDYVLAEHVNHLQDAVYAIETTLGENPQEDSINLSTRLTSLAENKKLSVPSVLLYSGDPSIANGSTSVSEATEHFLSFDRVIFKDYDSYSSSLSLVEDLIEEVHLESGSKFYASIDAGTFTSNLSIDEVAVLVQRWENIGIDGIYFYNFEYDQGVTRSRQNELIEIVRSYGMSIIAECKVPDHVFSLANIDGMNVDNEQSSIGPNDGILYLGFGLDGLGYQDIGELNSVMEDFLSYRNSYGTSIYCMGNIDSSLEEEEKHKKYYYGQALSMIYSINGFHLIESGNTSGAIITYPTYPIVGNYYDSNPEIEFEFGELYRNSRAGRISIDESTHTYNFEDLKIPLSFIDLYGDNTKIDASKLTGTIPGEVVIDVVERINQSNDILLDSSKIDLATSNAGIQVIESINYASGFTSPKINSAAVSSLASSHIEDVVAEALTFNLQTLLDSGDLTGVFENFSAQWISSMNAYFNNFMAGSAEIDGLDAGVIRTGILDGNLINIDSITSDKLTIHANGGVNKWTGTIVLKDNSDVVSDPNPEMVLGKDIYKRLEYLEQSGSRTISTTDMVGTSLNNYLVMWETWVYCTADYSSTYNFESDTPLSLYINGNDVLNINNTIESYTLELSQGWNKVQVIQDHSTQLSTYFDPGLVFSDYVRLNEAGTPHPIARVDTYAEQNTQIIGDYFKTGTIKADHLDVEDVKTGLLEADLIKAMELYVKELVATDGEFEQLISDITLSNYINTTNIRVYSEAQEVDSETGLLSGNTGSLMIDNGGMIVSSLPKEVYSITNEVLSLDSGSLYNFSNKDLVVTTENIRIIDHNDGNVEKTLEEKWYEIYYVDGQILIMDDVLSANGITNYSIVADYDYRSQLWPSGSSLVKIDRLGIHIAQVQPGGGISWSTKLTGAGLNVNHAEIKSIDAGTIISSSLDVDTIISVGSNVRIKGSGLISVSQEGLERVLIGMYDPTPGSERYGIQISTPDQNIVLDKDGLYTSNSKFAIKSDGTIEAVDGIFKGDVYAQSGYIGSDTNRLTLDNQGIVLGTGSIVDTRDEANQKLKIDSTGIIAESGTIGGLNITEVTNSLGDAILGLQAQVEDLDGTVQNYTINPEEINLTGLESIVINTGSLVVKDGSPLETFLTLGKLNDTQYGLNVGLNNDAYVQLDQFGLIANNGTINTLEVTSEGNINIVGNITADSGSLNNLSVDGTINIGSGGSIVASNVVLDSSGISGPNFSLTDSNKSIGGWTIGSGSLTSANISINSDSQQIVVNTDDVVLGRYDGLNYGLKSGGVILNNEGLTGPSFNLTSTTKSIGGWNFTDTNLKSGNITLDSSLNRVSIDNGTNDEVILGEYDSTPGNEKYGIQAGSVILNSQGISGSGFSLTGSGIEASQGFIAGWTVNNTDIYKSTMHIDSSNEAIWMGSDFSTSKIKLSSDGTGNIGSVEFNKTIDLTEYSMYTPNFQIDSAGNVSISGDIHATSGIFEGEVRATSGWFGIDEDNSIQVSGSGLVAGSVVLDKNGLSMGEYFELNGTGLFLDSEASTIAIGTNFSVTSSGITATAGKIANWNIGTDTIYTDDSSLILDSANSKLIINTNDIVLGQYSSGNYGLKAGDTILDGSGITANQGSIGGWALSNSSIQNTSGIIRTRLSSGSITIQDITDPQNPIDKIMFLNDGTGKIGSTLLNSKVDLVNYDIYTPNFSIDESGNAYISGKIQATSGEIGGWNISTILSSQGSGIVLDPVSETISIDTDKAILGKYDGTNYGILASQGKIGGWTIGSTTLSAGNISLDSTSSNERISIGSNIILRTDGSAEIGQLSVDTDGYVYSPGFTIDSGGASFSGNLSASSGDIGGWSIGSGNLYTDFVDINSTNQLISVKDSDQVAQVAIGLYDPTLGSEKYGIKAGNTTLDNTGINAKQGTIGGININSESISTSGYTLYNTGLIEATNVDLKGHIDADTGSFGNTIHAGEEGIWTGSQVGDPVSSFWISAKDKVDPRDPDKTINSGDAYFKGQLSVDLGSVIDGGDLSINEGTIMAGDGNGAHVRMSYLNDTDGGEIFSQDENLDVIFRVNKNGATFKGSITATTGSILGDLSIGSEHNVYLDGSEGAIFLYDTTKENADNIVRLNNDGLYTSEDGGLTFNPALTGVGLNANAINDGTLMISDSGPGAAGITIRQWNELLDAYQDNIVMDPSGINVYNGAITVHSDTTGEVLIGGGYLRVKGLDMGVVTSNNFIGNGNFSMISEDYGLAQLTDGEVFLGSAQSSGGAVSNPTYHYAGWPDYGDRNPHTVYTYDVNPDGTLNPYDIENPEDPNYPNVTRVSFNPQWVGQHPNYDYAVIPNDACNFITVIDKNGDLVRHLKAWKGGLFGVAFTPDGTKMITCGDDIDRKRSPWDMAVFDVSDPNPNNWGMIGTIPVGEFPSKVECDDNGFAYCTVSLDNTVYKLDLNNMRVDDVITLTDPRGMPAVPQAMCIANDYSQIYVAGVVTDRLYVIDTGSGFSDPVAVHNMLPTMNHTGIIHDVRTMADGRIAVASASETNGFVGIFNLSTGEYDTYIDASMTSKMALSGDETTEELEKWFHTCTTLTHHPSQPILYVTPTNRCVVSVMDYSSGELVEAQRIEAGSNPSGAIMSRDYSKLYVSNHHYHTYPLGSNRIWGYRVSDNYYNTDDVFDTTQKYYHHNPSGMVMTGDQYLWVANRATDKIIVIDTYDWTNESKRVAIEEVGRNPYELKINNGGTKVFVSNDDANGEYEPDFITVVDVSTKTIDGKIYVADRPMGMEISDDDKYLYVACNERKMVQKINIATKRVVNSIDLEGKPKYLELVEDTLYASCFGIDKVFKIDSNSLTLTGQISCDKDPAQMLSLNGKIYIVNQGADNVMVFNVSDNTFLKRIEVGSRPKPIAHNPTEGLIYVGNSGEGSVCIIDETSEEVIEWCMTGDNPEFIQVSPNGQRWFVSAHGPEDIDSYGIGKPYVGDAYLDDDNLTHKYGAAYWVPSRSEWVRGMDNTLTSFSSVEFWPDKRLQGKKGYSHMTVMGMFDAFAQLEQDVYPLTNYSDGACEYTTEVIELEEGIGRQLQEDIADYRDIPGREKRRVNIVDAYDNTITYTEDVHYEVDYINNSVERLGDVIPPSRARANTGALNGTTPVDLITRGSEYNLIEVYPENQTVGKYKDGKDYVLNRANNTIERIIDSVTYSNEEGEVTSGYIFVEDAPIKEGSLTVKSDSLGALTYTEGVDYNVNYEDGKILILDETKIPDGTILFLDYIRTTAIGDGDILSITYRYMLSVRYYYHPYKRNYNDTVLSADIFWRWPRPGNQWVRMELDELVPKFIFVDNDQIDPWTPEYDLGTNPEKLQEYKGLRYSSKADRVKEANIVTSAETLSGELDDLKITDGMVELPSGEQWIKIDLGAVYYINQVFVSHAGDGRTINDVRVEISTDNVNWTEVYNNTPSPCNYTLEFDKTFDGQTYNGPERIKYLRVYSNGDSLGSNNFFKQVKMMGDWKVNDGYTFSSGTVWDSEGRKETYVTLSGEDLIRFDSPGSSTTPSSPMTPPSQRVRYRIYYTDPETGEHDIRNIKVSNYYNGEDYVGLRSDLEPEVGKHYDYVYDYINNTIKRTPDSNIGDGEEVIVIYRYVQENLSNLPLCIGYRDPLTGESVEDVPASVAETDETGAWIEWEFENAHRCDWYIGWIADIGLGDVDIYLDGDLVHSVSQHTAKVERFSQVSQDLSPGKHTIKFVQQQGRVNFDVIKLEDYQLFYNSTNVVASPLLNPIELFEWYPVNATTDKARKFLGRGSQVMSGAYNTVRTDKETKIPNHQVPIKYKVRFLTTLEDRGEPIEDYGSFGGETAGFTFERGSVMVTNVTMEEGVNPTYWRMAPAVDKYPGFMIEDWDPNDPTHTGIQNTHIADGSIDGNKIKTFSIMDQHISSNANIQESKLLLNYPTHDHANKAAIDLITGLGTSGSSTDVARADHTHSELADGTFTGNVSVGGDLTISGTLKDIGKYEIVHRRPLYGIAGDLQFQTDSTAWEILDHHYDLFGYALPAPKEGAARYYRLYAIYSDNITGTEDNGTVKPRMKLRNSSDDSTTFEWAMPFTGGTVDERRDQYSPYFQTSSTGNHYIEMKIQNDLSTYNNAEGREVGLEYLELIAYDVYEGGQ